MNVERILEQRGSTYGDFSSISQASQRIKRELYAALDKNKDYHQLPDHHKAALAEAVGMIAHKLARVVNGTVGHADSLTDIAGYAILIRDILNKGGE